MLWLQMRVGRADSSFSRGSAMDEMGFYVSQNLHHHSIRNIFYAPMSFFDTTVRFSTAGLRRAIDNWFSPWEESLAFLERISRVRRWFLRLDDST